MVMIALFQFLKAESRPEAIEKIEVYYYSMTIYSGNSHPLYMNGISFCEFDLECSFHNIQEFAQSFYKHAYYIPDVCLGYEKMMIRGYVPFPSSYSKALCLQNSLSCHSIKKTINIEKEKVVVEYCQFTGIFWVGDQKVFGCLSADVAEVYHIRLKDKCYILKDILNFYDNIREGSGGVPVDTLKTTGYKRTALRTAKEQNRVTHVRAEQCLQVYQPHPINAVRVAKMGANSSYVGNFENEDHAGNGLLPQGLSYSQLRQAQEGVIAACYDSLGYSYIPMNHRDAKDIVMIPTGGKDTQRRGANPNIEGQRVYYYCTDHIGSTRLVLDDSARIAERLMFLPTGEVFMNEQNSTLYHSDFLFSGKELDAETGNYYFGARYLAPRLGIWLSPDPMQLKYPHVSSYAYCMGNPVAYFDPDGRKIKYGPRAQNNKMYQDNFAAAVKILNKANVGYILAQLEALDATIYIEPLPMSERLKKEGAYFNPDNNTIYWDYDEHMTTNVEGVILSPMTILNHEADHALDYNISPESAELLKKNRDTPDPDFKNKAERKTIMGIEQVTAKALGEIKDGQVTRTDHMGIGYFGVSCEAYLGE